MSPFNPDRRFENRMKDCVAKGKIEEAKIIDRDSIGAAHRLLVTGEAQTFLELRETPALTENDERIRLLRKSDWERPEFVKTVRNKIRGLQGANLESHVLLSHLEKGQSTPMAGEALFWDIRIPKGGRPLPALAAKKIFQAFNILHNLPGEAHRHFPIILDGYSLGHSTRDSIYAALVAQELENPELPPEYAALGALMHDLGKIPKKINQVVRAEKKYQENDDEYKLIKLHPTIGAAIWEELTSGIAPIVKDILPRGLIYNGILEHHLQPDGKGYPDFLGNGVTSLIGRVIGLVDSFDAMTSNRKYAEKRLDPVGYAREELKRCSLLNWDKTKTVKQEPKHQFDTELVKIFLNLNLTPVLRKAA